MKRSRAVGAHGKRVLTRDVADVRLESILGEALGHPVHERVAGDLGDDRGGCDRSAGSVAAHHGGVGKISDRKPEAVGEADVGRRIEPRSARSRA